MNITEFKTAVRELPENELAEFLEWLDEFQAALADRQWIDTVRVKIDAAVAMSEHTPPIDGETFIAGICDRFRQVRESKQGYTN
jgi:antitoxin ParD1/3/4